MIVLGAERSGTSVVAEMVHKWGAYAGELEVVRRGDGQNPQGYWEYTPIWDFLVELGEFAVGVSWWDVSFQDRVREKACIPRYRDKAQGLIADMEKAEKPWVWKDPALSFFLPFWQAIWGDAAYIITVRNPYDTALSWQKFVMPPRLGCSVSIIPGNLLRWQHIMLLILEHTEGVQRRIFMPYEGVVLEPRDQAGRLLRFLNRDCEMAPEGDVGVETLAGAVSPELWHNRSLIPFSKLQEATDEQKALYELLRARVADPLERFDAREYPMPPGWRELVKRDEALVRASLEGRCSTR